MNDRIIKFNVWIPPNKDEGFKGEYVRFDNWLETNEDWLSTDDNIRLSCFLSDCEDCVLLQYTGIKDKYGNEIYEGDVVELPYINKRRDCSECAVVKFSEGSFIFEPLDEECEVVQINDSSCKIICNIYEISDFLEEWLEYIKNISFTKARATSCVGFKEFLFGGISKQKVRCVNANKGE